jgi:hypothetical protein
MIQLETCYSVLELITAYGGGASQGYSQVYQLIHGQSIRYRPLFVADPTLGIKIGRFLDIVFDSFCHNGSDRRELSVRKFPAANFCPP